MNNQEWKSVSDIMSILMVVFLFISISYMYQKNIPAINNEKIKRDIYNSLKDAFPSKAESLNIVINKNSTIVFSDISLIFNKNEDKIKTESKVKLKNFIIKYIDVLNDGYEKNISYIEIVGYSSSEWNGTNNMALKHINNLRLSQNRAFNVLEYFLSLSNIRSTPWVFDKFQSRGVGSAEPILDIKSKEDRKLSRRVEIKIKLKAQEL